MSTVCEKWSLEDLCDMTDEDMTELLEYYEPNEVPSLDDIRTARIKGIHTWDGSFGWGL